MAYCFCRTRYVDAVGIFNSCPIFVAEFQLQLTPFLMKIRFSLFCLITLFTFNSCKTDLDILAPYKEIPVIYGVINHRDPTHYIRVQKAFLGAGDAYSFSAVSDSNYFKDITVKLIQYKLSDSGDSTFKTPKAITLTDTVIQGKDGGLFFQPGQKLYITHAKLDSSFSVKLEVINNQSGKVYTAFTPLINHITITKPNTSEVSKIGFASDLGTYRSFTIDWNSDKNGYYSELFLVFKYTAKYMNNGVPSYLQDSIMWPQSAVFWSKGDGAFSLELQGKEFYKKIQAAIPNPGDTLERVFTGIDFIADVGGREFYNYLTLNQPTSTVVQDKPTYTNISEGYGIFTTRIRGSRVGKQLTSEAKKELTDGQYTSYLKFK